MSLDDIVVKMKLNNGSSSGILFFMALALFVLKNFVVIFCEYLLYVSLNLIRDSSRSLLTSFI